MSRANYYITFCENVEKNNNESRQRTGLVDSDYLNIRFSKLIFFDRNVLLIIDEIYLSKRVESSGGQVFGLTESCAAGLCGLCGQDCVGGQDCVAAWSSDLKHRTDDQHGLGLKTTCAILLCPWERHFTVLSPAWWFWQAVLNYNNISTNY